MATWRQDKICTKRKITRGDSLDNKLATKILCNINQEKLREYCDEVIKVGNLEVIKEPSIGLVMARSKESVNQAVFNLGEVLITDCTVKLDEAFGYGVVMGNNREKAKYIAVIDALMHLESPTYKDLNKELEEMLKEEEKLQKKSKMEEFARVNKTKINFNSMD